MNKYTGSLDELKELVGGCGAEGEWTDIPYGHQFRGRDGAILNWNPKKGRIWFQGEHEARERLDRALTEAGGTAEAEAVRRPKAAVPVERPKVFVVHGHDTTTREQLELILHRLGLEPFVLANTGGGGLTIIEALEREIVEPHIRARFGIVLLTPDDM